MRPPTVNNNHLSQHDVNSNITQLNLNNQFIDYSITELQEMISNQQEQIKQNQQLIHLREQHLKYINQKQVTKENLRIKYIKQQEIKNIRLKILQNEINSNSTAFDDQLEVLKQIYLNKEHELTTSLTKLDEFTKQLDQLQQLKLSTNNDQLEKLKQELIIRNNLNEQQSHQIISQREIFSLKQEELSQLNQRIDKLKNNLRKKKNNNSQISNDFRTALNSVQDTLNNINIAEIEKRMIQLANSFNSINTNDSNNQKNIINNNNNSSKISFASKSEIAATYMTPPLTTTVTAIPINISISSDSDEQLLPAKLRLNDDILSVHFNNKTSNIKKRHSVSDSNDLLNQYLISNIEQQQQQPIQVHDDLLTSSSVSDLKPTIIDYENLDDEEPKTIIDSFISDTESEGSISEDIQSVLSFPTTITPPNLKSLLKTPTTPKNTSRRVIFDPLALLLDAAVLGELDLLIKSANEVKNPSQPNDEGLTALHNAVCSSNFECIKFLVEFGCDINYADNDGWTSLHCAASCNNTLIVQFLVEHGACIYATTNRDNETAAEKCEEEEENYISCSQYLLNVQNELGVINGGLVYALYDYELNCSENDELEFKNGDKLIILRRGDENENEWWWAKHENTKKEGYVPRNYLGLYPRVQPGSISSIND